MSRRFDNFAAKLEGRAAETVPGEESPDAPNTPDTPQGEPEPQPQPKDEAPMADTTDTPLAEREDYKAGYAAAETAANERIRAVFASEHFAGREAHAARLLGNAKLDAGDIIAELPNFSKAEANTLTPEQQTEAAEKGGRAEMREAMTAAGNKDLGSDQNSDANSGRAKADNVWARAWGLDKEGSK